MLRPAGVEVTWGDAPAPHWLGRTPPPHRRLDVLPRPYPAPRRLPRAGRRPCETLDARRRPDRARARRAMGRGAARRRRRDARLVQAAAGALGRRGEAARRDARRDMRKVLRALPRAPEG